MPIDGRGNQIVPLPASVALPAIVHAQYPGKGAFTVDSVDAQGRSIQVVGSSGGYEGTFPVGFIEPAVSLRVSAAGPWHLDIANANLAPTFSAGIAGTGDAVLSYIGVAARVRLVHNDRSWFIVRIYSNGGLKLVADDTAPHNEQTRLPAGPAFVAVTASGKWSIVPA